jgi:putrescine aminotransferase
MIVTAKALTSGYVPMGAVLISDRVKQMLDGANFAHGFTFTGHPVGAAVALVNLDIIEREGLVARAREMGEWMVTELKRLESEAPVVEARGSGMMFGVQLATEAAPVVAGARQAGVLVRGVGTTIIVCPPLVIEREQAQRIVDVLATTVGKMG